MTTVLEYSKKMDNKLKHINMTNGCTKSVRQRSSKAIIPSPDKIILYNLGKSKELKKGDKQFEKEQELGVKRDSFSPIKYSKQRST